MVWIFTLGLGIGFVGGAVVMVLLLHWATQAEREAAEAAQHVGKYGKG
jgi:hypothetical protein